MTEEIITPDQALRIGLEFIQTKYYNAKVTLDKAELVTEGDSPVYNLEGKVKMKTPQILGRLLYPTLAYTLKVQVHAVDESILNYELR